MALSAIWLIGAVFDLSGSWQSGLPLEERRKLEATLRETDCAVSVSRGSLTKEECEELLELSSQALEVANELQKRNVKNFKETLAWGVSVPIVFLCFGFVISWVSRGFRR